MPISKYSRYSYLNEITKYPSSTNVLSLSNLNSVSVWVSLDRSSEASKQSFKSKVLIHFFLLYLVSGQRPTMIKSKSNKDLILIKSSLKSSRKVLIFLNKFFLVYDKKVRQKLFSTDKLSNNVFRVTVWDTSFFTELEDVLELFQSVEKINLDLVFTHSNNKKNINFLKNLWLSSFKNK
jgi:hypothetical protein